MPKILMVVNIIAIPIEKSVFPSVNTVEIQFIPPMTNPIVVRRPIAALMIPINNSFAKVLVGRSDAFCVINLDSSQSIRPNFFRLQKKSYL